MTSGSSIKPGVLEGRVENEIVAVSEDRGIDRRIRVGVLLLAISIRICEDDLAHERTRSRRD